MKRPVLLFVLCLILTTIPVVAEETEIEPAPGQSVMTLEEYLKQGGEEWFLTGKKEYSVQGMMVSEVTTFHNELEAADYTVTDDDETVILKGLHSEGLTISVL